MAAFLLVIGDREAIGWILAEQRTAFPAIRRQEVAAVQPGDSFFVYTTRGCFKNPTRDRGRVIAEAVVQTEVERLEQPVEFAGREFPAGCDLEIAEVAPWGTGIELGALVGELDAFAPAGDHWSILLRRPLLRLYDRDATRLRDELRNVVIERAAALDGYTRWYAPATNG